MARRAKKPRKLTKAEQIARMPIEAMVRLGGPEGRKELEGYLRTLRSGYKRRVQSFARNDLVSYAQIAFEGSGPIGTRPMKKMTRNQIIYEIARYQKFFTDVTSNAEGIARVNREQDIRIFGTDIKGRPLYTMNNEERKAYWRLYDEYKVQYKSEFASQASEQVQQMLADMYTLGWEDYSTNTYTTAVFPDKDSPDFLKFLGVLAKRMEEAQDLENLGSVPNVYSGRGPFNTR